MTKYVFAYAVILISTLMAAKPAVAAENYLTASTKSYVQRDSTYSSAFRLSVVGGASLPDLSGTNTGLTGAALIDIGSGRFSFQTGAQFMQISSRITLSDTEGGGNHGMAVMSQYVGVPLLLKYNYIEHRNTSFSFKAGVMPALMMNNQAQVTDTTGTGQNVQLNTNELLMIGGITGVTPISKLYGFLMDISYFYGTSDIDYNGAHNYGALVSLGLTFNL